MKELFQGLIVYAVLCVNIYYQLTPNPLVAGMLGIGVVYLLGWLLSLARSLFTSSPDEPSDEIDRSRTIRVDFPQPLKNIGRPGIRNDIGKFL